VAGWGRIVIGAALGAVGTLYATNEEFRKRLPEGARELPTEVRRRLAAAREAAREASATRRAEILRELEAHEGGHAVGANRERLAPAIPASPDEVAGAPNDATPEGERGVVVHRRETSEKTERRG
jgi:hypothetical protein